MSPNSTPNKALRHSLTCVTLLMCLTVCLVVCASGCHRSLYRMKADEDAYCLIDVKAGDLGTTLDSYSIDVDPRSRMFDPFDPDCSPIPMDDPESHRLMHCVDCKRGYPCWHINGDADAPENPDWLQHLPKDENGVLVLGMDDAVQLALLHSPDYQQEFETLYLSALDVTAERFQFDTQFFGGYGVDYRASGRESGRPRSRLTVGTTRVTSGTSVGTVGGTGLTANRFFTTGAQAVVGFANQFVWDFAGNNSMSSMSLLNFSVIQPLLRQAGRDKIMESLTQSERTLLSNVRQMERFRRGFYLQVSTGRDAGPGATRTARQFLNAGAATPQAGGFIGLVQAQQNIRNQRANITGLRSNLLRLQETLEENLKKRLEDPTVIIRNRVQIAQAQQALYNAEFRLLNAQNSYQQSLDAYKVSLGLPPHVCIKIEDDLLSDFNLIDPEIIPLQEEIASLRQSIATLNEAVLGQIVRREVGNQTVETVEWNDTLQKQLKQFRTAIDRIKAIQEELTTSNVDRTGEDIAQLEEAIPERQAGLKKLRARYDVELTEAVQREIDCQKRLPPDIDPAVLDPDRLKNLPKELKGEFARLKRELGTYGERIAKVESILDDIDGSEGRDPQELAEILSTSLIYAMPELLSELESDMLDLSLVQANARAESIDLVPVSIEMDEALQIASHHRRDWMNNRAALVDNWRQIEFFADDLEGFLNVVVDGDIGTKGNNPLKFRSTTGTIRVGLQFDAPFTRLLERNTYREALISYQQSRRLYYQYVDSVSQNLRNTLRTMELNKVNFETRRVAVLAAIQQVVLNDEVQRLNDERGISQGATAARDIVQALSDLQNAQDSFMGVWVNYEVLRRSLDFDLGTMEVDPVGLWVDPGPMGKEHATHLEDGDDAEAEMILAPDDARYLDRNADDMSGGEAGTSDPSSPGPISEDAPQLPFEDAPAPPANTPVPSELPAPTTSAPVPPLRLIAPAAHTEPIKEDGQLRLVWKAEKGVRNTQGSLVLPTVTKKELPATSSRPTNRLRR